MYHAEISRIGAALASTTPPSSMPVKVVAIDGHGGSGKSRLASELSENLEAAVINTDDFASWDRPHDWWPELIERVLLPIQRGAQSLSYPRSSWGPDHKPEPVADQQVTPVMILEGVSSARKEFRSYLSFAIWVDTPKETCITRGLARDGPDKLGQWEKWWADEETYIRRHHPLAYVDMIVNGA